MTHRKSKCSKGQTICTQFLMVGLKEHTVVFSMWNFEFFSNYVSITCKPTNELIQQIPTLENNSYTAFTQLFTEAGTLVTNGSWDNIQCS